MKGAIHEDTTLRTSVEGRTWTVASDRKVSVFEGADRTFIAFSDLLELIDALEALEEAGTKKWNWP